MDTVPPATWTPERFMGWVEAQERRIEFDGVAPVDMTGNTWAHDKVAGNLYAALRSGLRGTTLHYNGPNVAVRPGLSVRYPDAIVTAVRHSSGDRVVTAPLVIFEVLSPSTARVDRSIKLREYATLPTVLRYVLIETEFAGGTAFARTDDTLPWVANPFGAGEKLDLPELGISFPVDELYEDVDLPPEVDDGR